MSSKHNIENKVKIEYEKLHFEYSDALWQKLDAELEPYRKGEERKRRVAAYWWAAAVSVLLMGGIGAAYRYATSNGDKVAKSTSPTPTKKQKVSTAEGNESSNEITAQRIINESTEATTVLSDDITTIRNTNSVSSTDYASATTRISSSNKKANSKNLKQPNSKKELAINYKKNDKVVDSKSTLASGISNADVDFAAATNNQTPAATSKGVKMPLEPALNEQSKDNEAKSIIESGANDADATSNQSSIENQTSSKSTDNQLDIAKENKNLIKSKKSYELFAVAGGNVSSSFKQPGYFAGVTTVLNIDDRRIFAGLRLNSNQLNHQLLASKNASVTTQSTDAVINKLTTLQLSFGYQFKINSKKSKNTTYLSTGFEPSYATGVQTIFYDDQGIPGGPRTPVLNSPLLNKAINKFNVSFIVGLDKYVTKKTAISFKTGYNLISLTDRQYYTRTSKSNNLYYAQLGLQFKLK